MSPVGRPRLRLAQQEAADELLSRDPFALLTGMLLDQQIPMEKAFTGPWLIAQRLGADRLDPRDVASVPPAEFEAAMAGPPAVHRFPAAMAARVQALARHVVEVHGGDAAAVWSGAGSGAELLRRLRALPGFGEQKARIFLALLGKRLQVCPAGWREAAGEYGQAGGYRSVADIVDEDSLARVREYKRARRAGG